MWIIYSGGNGVVVPWWNHFGGRGQIRDEGRQAERGQFQSDDRKVQKNIYSLAVHTERSRFSREK